MHSPAPLTIVTTADIQFTNENVQFPTYWVVNGISLGTFKKNTAPPPMSLPLLPDGSLDIVVAMNGTCDATTSIKVMPHLSEVGGHANAVSKPFAQGCILSATWFQKIKTQVQQPAYIVNVTVGGFSNCSTTSKTVSQSWPTWASPLLVASIVLLTIILIALAIISVVYNTLKVKKLHLILKGVKIS